MKKIKILASFALVGLTVFGLASCGNGTSQSTSTTKTDSEAQTAITNDTLTAQKTRNQYVWVPISSSELANMYHTSSGKIYGNYFKWPSTEPTDWTSTTAINKTTNTREPALVTSYDDDYRYLTQYMNGITKDEFLYEMQTRFYEMLQSIATYGGFYCR